jgi:hypothetical protein
MLEGDNRVLEAKKTTFWSRYGLRNFIFLFLVELGTCQEEWNIEKKIISHN